jgi:putative hydrolase of HD superfamily
MSVLLQRYPSDVMRDICDLREEFENQTSLESKFVKALDKIEVRIQHNEADISTWSDIEFPRALFSADQYCQFDDVVTQFNDLIKEESRQKIMNQSSKNIVDIEEEVKKLNQS